jgi:hypothetical protein
MENEMERMNQGLTMVRAIERRGADYCERLRFPVTIRLQSQIQAENKRLSNEFERQLYVLLPRFHRTRNILYWLSPCTFASIRKGGAGSGQRGVQAIRRRGNAHKQLNHTLVALVSLTPLVTLVTLTFG